MKERPILFSGAMVRALLAGTKTQTRRVCKPAQFYSLSHVVDVPDPQERGQVYNGSHFGDEEGDVQFASPYGGRGDRLWVRETGAFACREAPIYAADGKQGGWKWAPSIHMPRWASRITLEVTGVRVERLQDISAGDCWAEGIPASPDVDPVHEYRDLWESINGPDSWAANPWVWVVEFKRLEAA